MSHHLSDPVRRLVGLENVLRKARRRHHETEREKAPEARRKAYGKLVEQLREEIHSTDREQLEAYLDYLEGSLLARLGDRVEDTQQEMLAHARQIVDRRANLMELRREYTDGLDRSRTLRELLGLEAIQPMEVRFAPGAPVDRSDRRARDAYDIVKGYLTQ